MHGLLPWMSPLLVAWGVIAGAVGTRWLGTRRAPGPGPLLPESAADNGFEAGRTQTTAEALDIETLLGTVLRSLQGEAARLLARMRLAAREDLLVHADRQALGGALKAMVRTALELSPCAAILVTARRHGGRIEISVLADGPAESEATVRAVLRQAEAVIALLGGTMEVDPAPDGAVIRARLPEFVARSAEPATERRAEPGPAAPVRQRPVEAEARAIT